jgi:CheY-like chemotaxis protein
MTAARRLSRPAAFLPDMAPIDIGMPYLNGHEMVARIWQQRVSEHVIVVAVTGWTREEDKQRAYL